MQIDAVGWVVATPVRRNREGGRHENRLVRIRLLARIDRRLFRSGGNLAMLALAGDNVSCARFLAPDFVVAMLTEVGKGAIKAVGQPASFEIER